MKAFKAFAALAVLGTIACVSRSSQACYVPFNDPLALYWMDSSCARDTFQPTEYPAACGDDYIFMTSFTTDGETDPGHFHLNFKARDFYCYNNTSDGSDIDFCGIDSTGGFRKWTGSPTSCPDATYLDPRCVAPPDQDPGPWCNEPRYAQPHDSNFGFEIGLYDGRVFDLTSIRIGYWNQYLIPAYTSRPVASPPQNVMIWWWDNNVGNWQAIELKAPGYYTFTAGAIHTDTIWVENSDLYSSVPLELDDFTLAGFNL